MPDIPLLIFIRAVFPQDAGIPGQHVEAGEIRSRMPRFLVLFYRDIHEVLAPESDPLYVLYPFIHIRLHLGNMT